MIKEYENNNNRLKEIKDNARIELNSFLKKNHKLVARIESLTDKLKDEPLTMNGMCFVYKDPAIEKLDKKLNKKCRKLLKRVRKYFKKIPGMETEGVYHQIHGLDSFPYKLVTRFIGDYESFIGDSITIGAQGDLEQEIVNLEITNYDLIINIINHVLSELNPGKELNGTYWGAGYDWCMSYIKGINYFLGQYEESQIAEARIHNIKLVDHDVKKGHAFKEESQNLALIKTINLGYHEARNDFWDNIYHSLEKDGLVISDVAVPEEFNKFFEHVPTMLDKVSKPEWVSGNKVPARTGYPPKKFKVYKKR